MSIIKVSVQKPEKSSLRNHMVYVHNDNGKNNSHRNCEMHVNDEMRMVFFYDENGDLVASYPATSIQKITTNKTNGG